MKNTTITTDDVKHIAELANIPIDDKEAKELQTAFIETLDTIQELQSVDITKVSPTHQVTGFENVLREDKINTQNMLSQEEALSNASQTYQGYFVVPRLIDKN